MRSCIVLIISILIIFNITCVYSSKKKEKNTNTKNDNKDSSNIENSLKRDEQLSNLLLTNTLIPLSDKNFSKFITERPRNYHAAVLFTATDKKYQCSVCVSTKILINEVAGYYKDEYDFNKTDISQRLAFFILEVDNSRDIFNELNLQTVPRFYLLPPRGLNDPKSNMGEFEVDNRLLTEGSSSLMNTIENMTKIKISISQDPGPVLVVLGIIALLLGLFASLASGQVSKAIFWYRNTTLWTIFSLVCFSVGVSGSIFCIIRSAPPYGISRQGIRLFAPQGRDQYLIEGIIIALLTIGCGASIALAQLFSKLRFPVIRFLGIILSITIFIVCLIQIWDAYIDKTRWYNLKDTLPPQVWEWISSTVKKNSSLIKRLFRLSEYWLFEYKDLNSFIKKIKLLIFDYIVRYYALESNSIVKYIETYFENNFN